MSRSKEKLTPRQKEGIRLLAKGRRPSQVARELGIGRRTLWNWRQLPRFQKRLTKYMQDLDEYSKRMERRALALAWETVMRMMKSKRAVPRTVAQSRAAAVQLVLTALSRRGESVKVRHAGTVQHAHEHQGAVTIDERTLTKARKERLKELLDLTREFDNVN
jgi:Helix-turn-helix of insertion element transposase